MRRVEGDVENVRPANHQQVGLADERIEREANAILGENDHDPEDPAYYTDLTEHPFWRYRSGADRFDLAPVEPYLDMSKDPVRFEIKRLTRSQWNRVKSAIERGINLREAHETAFRWGVKAIHGVELALEVSGTKAKTLTDRDMNTIERAFGREIFDEVGRAVVTASGDLTPPE